MAKPLGIAAVAFLYVFYVNDAGTMYFYLYLYLFVFAVWSIAGGQD